MQPIEEILRERFGVAMGLAFGAENIIDPLIKTADPRHADYQANVAMPLGKRVGLPPREVATRILANLKIEDVCETPTVAGPGFINLRLKKGFLVAALNEAFTDASGHGLVPKVAKPATVVIDYSGPNVAKQMHVGHLRSTIIGDTLARAMAFLGHHVIRQNHIGDFGTQFGMLIHHLRELGATGSNFSIEDLDRYYKEATAKFKSDKAFAEKARKTVVELQGGGKEAVDVWNRMRVATHAHYTEIYDLLNVTLTDDHERGESFYGERLPRIVERVKQTLEFGGEGAEVAELAGTAADTVDDPIGHDPPPAPKENGLPQTQDAEHRVAEAKEPAVITKPFAAYSASAFCVFLPGYVGKKKEPVPLMLQKGDGGYPYSATDLAALYFRVQEHKETPAEQKPLKGDWHADRVVYLTDARQSQHFAMVFDAFRAAQWDRNPHTHEPVTLEHAPFGSILGEDGKPFKTRSGDTVKLHDLLIEAIERAGKVEAARGAELSPEKRAKVDRAVGIGAVKYADLKQDRTTDYIFAWERMLSLEGNTGPYLQMQYTRIQSIYRKGGITPAQVVAANPKLLLEHENEAALAKKLLQFGGVVEAVARDLKPHLLCTYLYEVCGAFSRFFESCPVLKAGSEELKMSRLLLCERVSRVLRIGLSDLLGIEVMDEM
ncbi:MAG: arginine--tRNA ligase [Phycisphaerae bacterium]